MKVAAIIQARMGSTRLPGKILKTVNGKTLLEYQIERVKHAKTINQIIIATTVKEEDNIIVDLCNNLELDYYRGSEDDVLSRYYEAANAYKVDVIVRLTSDCPLIDPIVIDRVVNCYIENQPLADYVSNIIERTYPRGLDTEVFSYKALKKAYKEASFPSEREHVTPFIYFHPEIFNIKYVKNENDYSNFRWTVDTIEDFELISLILDKLYNPNKTFYMKDVIELLHIYPEWIEINAHIKQKKL